MPEPETDGTARVCDGCGETFQTLTKLRLHEKDDCQARVDYPEIDPDGGDAGAQAATQLLTCLGCGRENPNADYQQTTSLAGDDFHIIVEFPCRHCGFENENRVVMEGVDRENVDQLPPHLQPDETEVD